MPKITSKWEFPNPDGTSQPIVFSLLDDGTIRGSVGKYTAAVSARKTNEGRQWVSRVNVNDTEPVARLDFFHLQPEGSAMTDEITDFCAGILWSLCRADAIKLQQFRQQTTGPTAPESEEK